MDSGSLIEALWRRRWIVALSLLISFASAAAYLHKATPIYRSTARLWIEQNAPRAHSDNSSYPGYSDTYIQSQVDAISSSVVLGRALKSLEPAAMKTFAHAGADP